MNSARASGITAVIPTLNRTDLLRTCIDSLRAQCGDPIAIVVVDDGSSEDVPGYLSAHYPEVRCIRLDENRGFATAANAGIAIAETEYLLLLNNDMTLESGCVEGLRAELESNANLAGTGPLILCADDPDVVYSAGDRLRPGGRPESIGHLQPRGRLQPESPFAITAGCALIRREVFDRIGAFDETFVAYYEDVDWCYRARRAGWSFALVSDAIARHEGSASLNGRHLWRAQQCHRNHALLLLKNMPTVEFVRHAPAIARERFHQNARLFTLARCEAGFARATAVSVQAAFGLARLVPAALKERRRHRSGRESHEAESTRDSYVRTVNNDLPAPDVTVALLTRNAGLTLDRILDAVESQNTPRSIEILAIDSASTDGTPERLKARGAHVISIAAEHFNFGTTRDLLYRHARGDIVVNLSQDAVPAHANWIETLLAPLNDPAVAVSCGRSIPDAERGNAQFAWERNGYFYFTREMKRYARRHGRGVSFANSAVRRSVWERHPFDAQVLGEDFQFQIKIQNDGLGAAFPEGAEVLHHHDYSTATLYRRCRDEGAALRALGCRYSEIDLLIDLVAWKKNVQWLREIRHRRIDSAAGFLFPVLRPVAVYVGSRLGTRTERSDPNREALNHG